MGYLKTGEQQISPLYTRKEIGQSLVTIDQ